jgi:hypothetical protein
MRAVWQLRPARYERSGAQRIRRPGPDPGSILNVNRHPGLDPGSISNVKMGPDFHQDDGA